jgi:hypothetical protein
VNSIVEVFSYVTLGTAGIICLFIYCAMKMSDKE